jgi:hypothetical protein
MQMKAQHRAKDCASERPTCTVRTTKQNYVDETSCERMRPTGGLHLGNYEGALKNWVRLRCSLASSPMSPGRIEFVILRTGRSPPTAPHHTSLRRSCCRLQAGERLPEEDFHLSDHLRFQAHECGNLSPLLVSYWSTTIYTGRCNQTKAAGQNLAS